MSESQRDSIIQPKVGCAADYLGSTFKSSTTPKRVASVFGSRLCAEHQPQHPGNWWGERPREPALARHSLCDDGPPVASPHLRLVLQTQPRSDERPGHNSFRVVICFHGHPG